MVVATDMSTLMAQFKCGSKGLQDIDRDFNQTEDLLINFAYGYDLIKALRIKSLRLDPLSLSPKTTENINTLLKEGNTKPFFIFIRDPEKLYRAQIIQSFRNFCRKYEIFEENTTLFPRDIPLKEKMFKTLHELYPKFYKEIFDDPHYIQYTFDEALAFIQYVENNRKDIYNHLFLLDLDSYDTSKESLDLLYSYKVINEHYIENVNWTHSSKISYLPEILFSSNIKGLYRLPYEKNKSAIKLINLLYEDKFYSYERFKKYLNPPI